MTELPDDVYLWLVQYLGPREQLMLSRTSHYMTALINTPLLQEYRKAKSMDLLVSCRKKLLNLATWIVDHRPMSYIKQDGLLEAIVRNGWEDLVIFISNEQLHMGVKEPDQTAVHRACSNKSNSYLMWILANYPNYDAAYIFTTAIANDNIPVIDAVLDKNAAPYAAYAAYATYKVMLLVCEYGRLDLFKKLYPHAPKGIAHNISYLVKAICNEEWDVVDYMLALDSVDDPRYIMKHALMEVFRYKISESRLISIAEYMIENHNWDIAEDGTDCIVSAALGGKSKVVRWAFRKQSQKPE